MPVRLKRIICSIFALICAFSHTACQSGVNDDNMAVQPDQVLAFPGAVGAGKYATGGLGYTNIEYYINDLTIDSFPEGAVTLSPIVN